MGSRRVSLVDLGRAIGEGWCALVQGALRGETLVLPGASLGVGGEAFSDMNCGYVYGPEGVDVAVRRLARRLRRRRLPGTMAVLSPAVAEAVEAAEATGLVAGGSAAVMCARAADARHVEHDYVVTRVSDVDGVMDAADVLADAFEIPAEWLRAMLGPAFPDLPDADAFVAGRDGRALAVACTGRSGSTVGVFMVGTKSAHRRRGAAAAAVSAALDHHVRTGAHLFGLCANPEAEALCAGLGFTAVDHAQLWHVEGP